LPWINLRLASTINPSTFASDQLPTSLEIASFRLSFSSASNSRRLLLLRSSFRTNFHPSSALGLPAYLSINLRLAPDIASSSFAFETRPPAFAGCRVLQLSFRTDLRLASNIESSSSAFQPPSDSSSDIASLTSPSDQLPTCVGAPPSSSAFRPTSRLAPGVTSSGFPVESASDLHRPLRSPVLSAINLRLLSEFESSSGAVDQLPTCVGY